MWILTNLTNITNMNLIKTEQKRELLLKLLEFKGEEFAVQPGKCLYGHGRGGRWVGKRSNFHQKCKNLKGFTTLCGKYGQQDGGIKHRKVKDMLWMWSPHDKWSIWYFLLYCFIRFIVLDRDIVRPLQYSYFVAVLVSI